MNRIRVVSAVLSSRKNSKTKNKTFPISLIIHQVVLRFRHVYIFSTYMCYPI